MDSEDDVIEMERMFAEYRCGLHRRLNRQRRFYNVVFVIAMASQIGVAALAIAFSLSWWNYVLVVLVSAYFVVDHVRSLRNLTDIAIGFERDARELLESTHLAAERGADRFD